MLTVNGRQLELAVLQGVVEEVQESEETVYQQGYSVLANGTYMQSSVRRGTKLWLKNAGREFEVEYPDHIPVRKEHAASIVYLGWQGTGNQIAIAAWNQTNDTLLVMPVEQILTTLRIDLSSKAATRGLWVGLFGFLGSPFVGWSAGNVDVGFAAAGTAVVIFFWSMFSGSGALGANKQAFDQKLRRCISEHLRRANVQTS